MALVDYKTGERLAGFFAVRRLERREYNGKPYLTLILADRSASINAVMWDGFAEIVEQLQPGSVVKIQGMIGQFRDQPQIRLERLRLAQEHEYDLAELLPISHIPAAELAARLDEIVESVTDPHLQAMLKIIFGEGETREQFLACPGGQRWHHASVGGLAEHTFGVVDICEFCAGQYPELDHDLLICGALLHDLGKIKQYATSTIFEYTDSGRLLGHIVEGNEIVTAAIAKVSGFPQEKQMCLRHLILSHHGELAFASPVVPQTREAFVVYTADELDAKLGALRQIAEKTGDAPWSDYVRLIDRFIYFGKDKPTPTVGEPAAGGGGEE